MNIQNNTPFLKEYCKKVGIKSHYSRQRGSPGNPKLRFYISQMAGWYRDFYADKPGYGTFSIFPSLISDCLAMIDDELKDIFVEVADCSWFDLVLHMTKRYPILHKSKKIKKVIT